MLNYVFNFGSFTYCIFGLHCLLQPKVWLQTSCCLQLRNLLWEVGGALPRRGRRWWEWRWSRWKGRLSRPFSTECPSRRLPDAALLGGCLSSPAMRKDPEHTKAGKVLASVLVQITQRPQRTALPGPGPRAPPQGAPSVLPLRGPGGEQQPAEEGDPRVRETGLF